MIKAKCAICGAEFDKTRANKKYCSPRCANKANRDNMDIWHRKNYVYNKESEKTRDVRFDLEVGNIVVARDPKTEDKRFWKFRVIRIYDHFFECEKLSNGAIRSFTKGARICREVKRVGEE